MPQYLMSVHHSDGKVDLPLDEMEEAFAATGRFNDELQAEGVWVFAGGLYGPETATVVEINVPAKASAKRKSEISGERNA